MLCYNPREAERQRQHREKVVQELEHELDRHPKKKATAQWAIELKVSGRYGRYLRITKADNLALDRAAIREAQRRDGKWVLQTNDDTLSVEDVATGYKALLVIERCFRSLKRTQLKMSPMYHWLPRRIEAHVKGCVLALLIQRTAEISCKKPWARIRKDLGRLQATEFECEDFRFFQRNEPPKAVTDTLRDLAISLPNKVLQVSPQA